MKRAALLVLPAVALLGLAGCSSTTSVADAASADETLTFEIGGDATTGSVTYITDNFGTAQENDATLPWTKDVSYTTGTTGVNINAQNAGSGTITCKISKDGKVIAENSSTGEYAIVSCAVA